MDLGVGYLLTGLFGLAIMLISSQVSPDVMKGTSMVLSLANEVRTHTGSIGYWIFLVGFWGAVFSSMLGVWNGVPYIFQDCRRIQKRKEELSKKDYVGYLAYLAFPPMVLLALEKPIWVIIVYAVFGALFMPFLATTLLILNNRKNLVGDAKNSIGTNVCLVGAIAVFGYLLIDELLKRL